MCGFCALWHLIELLHGATLPVHTHCCAHTTRITDHGSRSVTKLSQSCRITKLQNHLHDLISILFYILSQSSGDFDPEAHPELKKPPDQSEIWIRRNLRNICISIRTKTMLRSYIKKWSGDSIGRSFYRNDSELKESYSKTGRTSWSQINSSIKIRQDLLLFIFGQINSSFLFMTCDIHKGLWRS